MVNENWTKISTGLAHRKYFLDVFFLNITLFAGIQRTDDTESGIEKQIGNGSSKSTAASATNLKQ
jgi:hypothetical protein